MLSVVFPGAPRVLLGELSELEEDIDSGHELSDENGQRHETREHRYIVQLRLWLMICSGVRRSLIDIANERSVSYKPVPPPTFCRIGDEARFFTRPTWPPPAVLSLSNDARCRCGAPAIIDSPIILMDCYVYGSMQAFLVKIEVKPCSGCDSRLRQYAGPDLSDLGMFNYTNQSIFTHEILDLYTSHYTSHPSAFHAFCETIDNHYKLWGSEVPFVSNSVFRNIWFSWRAKQGSASNMLSSTRCPKCGPEPDIIILDAKTVGFKTGHVLDSLTPPTEVMPSAPRRGKVTPPPNPTCCIHGRTRQQAQALCRWRAGLQNGESSVRGIATMDNDVDNAADVDVDEQGAATQLDARTARRNQLDLENLNSMSTIVRDLKRQSPAVAALFNKYVNTKWEKREEAHRKPYFELLTQVRVGSWDELHCFANLLTRSWHTNLCCNLHPGHPGLPLDCSATEAKLQLTAF